MALVKFYKRKEKPLSQLEEQVGKAIIEVEKASAENKALLKGLLVDNVKEIETTFQGKKSKNILLITVPFVCSKAMGIANKTLIAQLERKLGAYVCFSARRTIQSKWIKTHKSQMRPRSRTLTQVHEATLDDLIQPSVVLAKSIRCKLDGSKLYKVTLDQVDQASLEHKLHAITQLYKHLCQKEVVFTFAEDKQFYTLPNFK